MGKLLENPPIKGIDFETIMRKINNQKFIFWVETVHPDPKLVFGLEDLFRKS